MRSSILNRLLASSGCGCGGRIWRSKSSGCGSVLGGRRLISTTSKVGASPSPPWLMLPPGRGSSGDIVFNFYSLAEERQLSLGGGFPLEAADRFVGSSHGWLALYNDRTKSLFLTNPVSGCRINLPPPSSDSIHTVSRVVLSCSADNDECGAVMSFVPKVVDVDDRSTILTAKQLAAKQLAVYLAPMSLGAAERLAFCRPNAGVNGSWTPISTECYKSYGDFVYSRKRKYLFCLTTNYHAEVEEWESLYPKTWKPNLSDVEVWDFSDPGCPRIERRHSLTELPRLIRDSSGVSERRYLVYSEELDQLYLVRRHMMERVQVRGRNTGKFVKDIYFDNRGGWDNSYPYKTVGFDIHRIDDKDGKLLVDEKVSLDNVAIFIGINHGLVMEAAADQYQLNSNCIYFTDDTIHTPPNVRDVDEHNYFWHLFVRHKWDSKWAYPSSVYGGHDIGIFDCENKTISPCFYPIDPPSLKRIDPPPLWFTPHLNIT